jgi:hypothetical protein
MKWGCCRAISSAILVTVLLVAAVLGPAVQNSAYAADPPATIYRTVSGLVASDSLTTGDTSGWDFNGSAVGLNAPHSASEDSSGLHLGLLAPSADNWAGYFGITPLTPARLFHARITLGDARPVSGVLDTAVYVQQEMFQDPRIDAMGCGADVFPTETRWTISLQAGDADHEIINQSIYTDNSANQPTSRECTLITNGDNQLTAYIDGQKVFSSTKMNLNMPQPFQYYIELQTNSITPSTGSMFTGTFTDYYATTSDSIKVINAGASSVVRVIDAISGNVLASSIADSVGTAFVDVGEYHMPINANVIVYDSTGTSILATTTTADGSMYGGDVYNVASSATQTSTLNINSVDLSGTNPINGLFLTISRGTQLVVSSAFTPYTYDAVRDATYIVDIRNYGTHVFDHWEDGSRVRARVITPTTSTATLTASYRETSDPQPPISLTSMTQYTTRTTTPTIVGTAPAGYSVRLYDGANQIGSVATASTTGQWSITTPTLSQGRHVLSATAADGSGHTSTFSSPITTTIDTGLPSASVTSSNISSDSRILLVGTASDVGSGIKIVEVQTDGGATPFVPAAQAVPFTGDWSSWTFITAQLAAGSHQLTVRTTDLAGNIATSQPITFTVGQSQQDTTPPVITVPSDLTREATGPLGVVIAYTASATDAVDGPVPVSCTPASGSTFPLGTTTVTCTARDSAGNTATATFHASILDTTPPTVTVPASQTVQASSPSGATVTYSGQSATDIVDGSVPVSCIPASGSTFGIGTTTVQCSATDSHGNTGTNSFTITVTSAPTTADNTSITLQGTINVAWGKTITVTGTIRDDTTGTAISGARITFTGSGAAGLPASGITTDSTGTFTVTGISPSTVGTWQVIAHYAGDATHKSADSNTLTYNTLKHNLSLSMSLSPASVKSGRTYAVSGSLLDSNNNNAPVSLATITFAAASPITIPSTSTNSAGNYAVNGLIGPAKGSYNIQASFAGNSLYNPATSPIKALKVN